MARYDRMNFERRFEGLPPKAAAVIALRAAMRVLPALAYGEQDDAFQYWNESAKAQYALSTFRCYGLSFVINSLTQTSPDAARSAVRTARASTQAAWNAAAASVTAAAADALDAAAYAASANYRVTNTGSTASAGAYAARAAAHAAHATGYTDYIAGTILSDIEWFNHPKRFRLGSLFSEEVSQTEVVARLISPLWPEGEPQEFHALRTQLETDLRNLDAGFDIWIDWYQSRLESKPVDWDIERQCGLLSDEQLAQSTAEINAYLKALRQGWLTTQLKRVRAIFISHGEVGKTSLIRALHGEDVIEGQEAMTQGVVATDPRYTIDERAGVFTRVQQVEDGDLTVHFWDFGGQVMAHATHQFFLRSKCLYVIVLAGRAERNPNEEAEYWLEHVRAFGDSAPVLLVGNKTDILPVNLDLRTLVEKYPNITGFYSISCTQAKSRFKDEFALFRKKLGEQLKALGDRAERFSEAEFNVLKSIENKANQEDLLSEAGFDEVCAANGIPMGGPSGRHRLLDIFDKLGIVMHFPNLPFLTDLVLNPRWLTYGVYTIMYSERVRAARGKLGESDLVAILGKANLTNPNGHALRYPADKCRYIADAMVAFRVAYRLNMGEMVIPALLPPEQPEHDFKTDGALTFRFDFGGFLPRQIIPVLIAEYSKDIRRLRGNEVVWQNGVLLHPRHHEAQALVRADYHARNLDIWVKGGDAPLYLGMLRDSVLSTLETMPQLPFEEKVELRPEMLIEAVGQTRRDGQVWIAFEIVQAAQRSGDAGSWGRAGDNMRAILAAMPKSPFARPTDVFLSYAHEDGELVETFAVPSKLSASQHGTTAA